MQNVSDDEGKHIITASNVHKRLSFRGREKFVEAFCQGKHNYRWAELSQLIATPVDQAISWSSSDEEFDEASSQLQRGRHLPNRTLTSHINFADCKLVRKRGYRHSSAQFVRSIEKRPRERPGTCKDSPLAENSIETKPLATPSNMPDTTFKRGHSVRSSESIDHHDIWEKNLSILNETVNITPELSDNLPSSEKFDQHEHCNEITNTVSKIEATSPILVPRVNRIRRRRMTTRKELKPGEESVPVSKAVPSSPIFKTGKPKRGHLHKLTNSDPSRLGNKSHCEGRQHILLALKNNSLSETVSETTNLISQESSLKLSPQDSNRRLERPASPVIGRTVKRQKRMVVDKNMSPILGSKDAHRPFKMPKVARSMKRELMCKGINNIFVREDKTISEPSVIDTSLLNEAKFLGDEGESEVLTSQPKAAAKRSLDFSFEKNLSMKDIFDCHNSESQAKLSRQDQKFSLNGSVCDILNESNCDKSSVQITSEPEKIARTCDLALNKSNLIEDANTEQIDVVHIEDKPVMSPFQQKRNKLRLRKKSPLKTFHTKKMNRPSISAGSSRAVTFPEISCPRISSLVENEQDKECYAADTVQPSSYFKEHSNQTLFIEEDSSEPMTNLDAFGSPISSHSSDDALRNQIASLTAKLFEEVKATPTKSNTTKNADADIDSCSSQSPDASQQQDIERLPSSSVSTVVAISQTSSPPAPCNINGLLAERVSDDFNAPPKKGKNSKLKPDGLASRLQRLINRQRSSSRIWQFKRSKQSKSISTSAGSSEQNNSMLLTVDRTWTEYSHIIVQGHISNDGLKSRTTWYLDTLSDQVFVVLDPTIADKLEKIMSSSRIRIFPPWQSLKLKGISLILCAYCIEVVPSFSPNSKPKLSARNETKKLSHLLEGSEYVSGISLLEIIYPQLEEVQTHLVQYTEAISLEPPENTVASGSISSLVSHHYIGEATLDTLTLTILRAFQFRPLDTESGQSSDCPSWSLLGRDTFGEVCEVLLGYEQFQTTKESIWECVKTGAVIGETYCFSGFLPVQRIAPFRVSNLWKIISGMGIQGLCDQPVFYVLSSATFSWNCRLLETQRKTYIYQPTISSLVSILYEKISEPRRVNVFCCILHATKERLYVTDIETSPIITVIAVNPTAYLPPFIFKAKALIILDLEATGDELRIDKYSKVSSNEDLCVSFKNGLVSEEHQRCLSSLNPNLPLLHRNTPAKTLAIFFGTVVGVDEESAYMWPACGVCENELLSLGDGTENYRCEKCNNECDNFIKHMSLQVLCTCPDLPLTSSVRIKLHQSTIESLLPPTLCNEEGYDMNSVIGQQLGPLRCEVLHSKDGNVTLQELPKRQ